MLKISKVWFLLIALLVTKTSAEGAITPTSNAHPIHEAFVTKYNDPAAPVVIPVQPPADIQEKIPRKPSNDMIWIPGYWSWSQIQKNYVWVCGVWRRSPPNQYWISGGWQQQQNGWVWLRGFWYSSPEENLTFIPNTPPNSIDDQVPPSPGNQYFWIPGYWEYSYRTRNFSWLSGMWSPLNQNWILTPASYIWRPEGYVFVPFYWDWPLEMRGNAYSCLNPGIDSPSILEPQIIAQNLFMYYPDFITLFCHCWYFYPEWWDGCGCVPSWWWWDSWWGFCWGDMWGLWWWWGHPGFFPPFWLSFELSLKIAPPPFTIIDAFKKVPKPNFPVIPGPQPLLPKGTPGITDVPKPQIPNGVTPGGQVTPPLPPSRQVTPPTPPQMQFPPSIQQPTYPTYPSQPSQPIYPTQPTQPPSYYPPNTYQPPAYYPPRYPQAEQPTYPDRPPTRPNYPKPVDPKYPSQPPQRLTPPSSSYPQMPNRTPSYPYQPNRQPNINNRYNKG